MHDDTLILRGWAAKALDDSGTKFGGYLVMWGSPTKTDDSAHRDYFTPETEFGRLRETDILLEHGHNKAIDDEPIGLGTFEPDERGLFLKAELFTHDAYLARKGEDFLREFEAVKDKVRREKFGLSSGTTGHRVRREKQSNGSHHIKRWALGLDASLTETPAEPRTFIVSLKSLGLDDDPAPGPSLAESLTTLATDAMGLLPKVERAMKVREGQGRHLSADKVAGLKALHDEVGRLIACVEAPARAAEARNRLSRALLRLAVEG